MKTAALADALVCAFHSLTETLPVEHRRCVNAILYGVLRDVDLIRDVETRRIIWRLADLPTQRTHDRLGRPASAASSRRHGNARAAKRAAAQA